jgi:hypothetical protein
MPCKLPTRKRKFGSNYPKSGYEMKENLKILSTYDNKKINIYFTKLSPEN